MSERLNQISSKLWHIIIVLTVPTVISNPVEIDLVILEKL